jgi:hypothetical protein
VEHLGTRHPIEVAIDVWNIRGKWVAFVELSGNFSSYLLSQDWLRANFRCCAPIDRPAMITPNNFYLCIERILLQ